VLAQEGVDFKISDKTSSLAVAGKESYEVNPGTINQAFMVRYVFFTLAGALLLAGIAWSILCTRLAMGVWQRSLSGALILVMVSGQTLSIPIWQKGYLQLSRRALECYRDPGLFTPKDILWLTPHHPLEQGQIKDIHRFLQGPERGNVKLLDIGD
jgi:hypothetical protein